MFEPKTHVRWCAQQAHADGREIFLDAEVVRVSGPQVLIRARTKDGSLLFRWVSSETLREVTHAEG